ncbi:protein DETOXIFICATION 24-like [Euphorbia lathyris]|uniref:protein DETOXIFICATION 24-like n=1 Tax=Euphorbia lathyris TaxID=212925 RepID=UPI0033137B66
MVKAAEERLLVPEEVGNSESLKSRAWTESKKIWRVAFPGMVARVSGFGFIVITQLFIGQLGELPLAAYAIQQTVFLRFTNGILIGMSSATETLCGQSFGARQYHMLGIYLQRSWIVDGAVATVLLPLFIFGTQILEAIGQQKDIAVVAGQIALWFIPYQYFFVFSLTIQMFLQSQMKNQIVGWVFGLAFLVHVPMSWLFVTKLGLGIPGALGALNLSGWLSVIALFVYAFGGWCPNTWTGFSKAAFLDIMPVVKLSLSSGFMICLELWYNAILVLLAGYMKNATVEISAFSICLNINAWQFMIFLGFLGAASVRVSNELGRGDAKAAKFSIYVMLSTSVIMGIVFFILCLIFDRQLSYLFTSSDEVADQVSSLSILLAFSMLLNSIYPVLSGVAVGSGLQSMVAYVNLGCYYVIGIPIGVLLGYVAGLQVKGLWIGMLSGIVTQTVVLSWLIWRTNWDDQVKKASERLNRWLIEDPTNDESSRENSRNG